MHFRIASWGTREAIETYVKRLEELERIARLRGVEQAFAIQAGREIRVVVTPDEVDDARMTTCREEIARASKPSCSIRPDQGRRDPRDTGGGLCPLRSSMASRSPVAIRDEDHAREIGAVSARGERRGWPSCSSAKIRRARCMCGRRRKASRRARHAQRDDSACRTTTQDELLGVVRALNEDPMIHGILVQMPLPKHIDSDAVIRAIDPRRMSTDFVR